MHNRFVYLLEEYSISGKIRVVHTSNIHNLVSNRVKNMTGRVVHKS